MRGKILKAYEGSQYRYDGSGIRQEKRTSGEAVRIERLEKPETKYNFEVEDFHTYYVTECEILVHNKCKENYNWRKTREKYWKEQGKLYESKMTGDFSESGTYKVTQENVARMLKGKAPIGIDNYSVHLHHVYGRQGENIYYFVEITRTDHYLNYKSLHPWLYKIR